MKTERNQFNRINREASSIVDHRWDGGEGGKQIDLQGKTMKYL